MMRRSRRPRSLVFAPVLCLAVGAGYTSACLNEDPLHTNAVNALGPEAANIPQGQYHRAGQPCGVCHGAEGPANTQFALAGTVFFGPGSTSNPVGVGNVTIQFLDDAQSMFSVQTNCVGNFWVSPSDWTPQFPVLVSIAGAPQGTTLTATMQSHIGRDPSCGNCHQYPTNLNYYETPGLIHLNGTDNSTYTGDSTCPVSPVLNVDGAP